MFFPAASNVSTVSLTNAGVEPFRVELKKILNDLLSKGDVLIMSDVKGGTPYNESYMGHPRQDDPLAQGARHPSYRVFVTLLFFISFQRIITY